LDYAGSPGLGFPPEPTSTERVLKVLKESRKRDVVEEGDGSFTAEQHSKRRYFIWIGFTGCSVTDLHMPLNTFLPLNFFLKQLIMFFCFLRRNDSGGSAHSAFEPRLPNGMTPQLVPK